MSEALSFKQVKEELGKAGFGVIPRDGKEQVKEKVAVCIGALSDEELERKKASLSPALWTWVEVELGLVEAPEALPSEEGVSGERIAGSARPTKTRGKNKAPKEHKVRGAAMARYDETSICFVAQKLFWEFPNDTMEQTVAKLAERTGKVINGKTIFSTRSNFRSAIAAFVQIGAFNAEALRHLGVKVSEAVSEDVEAVVEHPATEPEKVVEEASHSKAAHKTTKKGSKAVGTDHSASAAE